MKVFTRTNPERPRDLPTRIDCTVQPGRTAVRIIASLQGPGTARLTVDDATSPALPETTLCVPRTAMPRLLRIDLDLPPDAAAAFDLYDIPTADCSPGNP